MTTGGPVGTTLEKAYLLRKVPVKAAHLARLLQHPGVQAKLANLNFRLAETRTTVRLVPVTPGGQALPF
jgi:hypothetical protein